MLIFLFILTTLIMIGTLFIITKDYTSSKQSSKQKSKHAVIMVSNQKYLEKACQTAKDVKTIGHWKHAIILLVGDDLKEYTNEIFTEVWYRKNQPCPPNRGGYDNFIYHKFNIFDKDLATYDQLIYIDAGMHIKSDMNPIIHALERGKVYARIDTPGDNLLRQWQTEGQAKVEEIFNASQFEHFQSTFILYDGSIIHNKIVDRLYQLCNEYPDSNGDQSIVNLYFGYEYKLYKTLPEGIYSFFPDEASIMYKREFPT